MLASYPTQGNRTDARSLAQASRQHSFESAEWTRLQRAAADLLVSCYTGNDEGGRPENVHETRRDGSCRCGIRKPRN